MTQIEHSEIGGERPLYNSQSILINDVVIRMGESALKHSKSVQVENCRIEGMYAFWECEDINCHDTYFASSARACSWYGKRHSYVKCLIDSPKMFRELQTLYLDDVKISEGSETFWNCSDVHISNTIIKNAPYCFMHTSNSHIDKLKEEGKYAFQYAKNIEIHNSSLKTKDAFWESEGCTIYDTIISGEYLGWYSKNLRLIRCHIFGTQPLCYCSNLILEDCIFDASADRCFEYSTVSGSIIGNVSSIVNPIEEKIEYK